MTPERFAQVDDLFRRACERPPPERSDFVAHAAGDDVALRDAVLELLAHDTSPQITLNSPVAEAVRQFGDSVVAGRDAPLPERVGPYRLVRVLGAGGFGVVYLAEQENPKRSVALKVLRPLLAGADVARRFEYEAQILARLQHPGIAQVFDAGVAAAGGVRQPYFALEHVRGAGLLAFADGENGRPALDTPARLRLFLRVCEAVQYAHQNGVIHRDLKPENILVDPHGQPKVVDFGVARVTDPALQLTVQTGSGELLGTLGYMSPEQLSGDPQRVDTRSDVYALGVVLFQLLSGRMPHDLERRSFPDAVRLVCDTPAQRLVSVRPELRGDLDVIVAQAMEKDVSRRYASVAQLAADVRAYLDSRPVSARPASALYHLRKLAGRHRALLVVGCVATLALVIGAAATAWQAVRATRARDRALAESRKAERVTRYLQSILTSADPNSTRGRDVSVREQLERAAARVHDEFADEPELEAAVRTTIGDTFINLGYYAAGEQHLRAALAIRRSQLGDDHVDTAATALALARALRDAEHFAEALPLCEQVLAVHRARGGADHEAYARALILKGDVCQRNPGGFQEAERAYREAIDIFTRLDGRRSAPVAVALGNLGSLLFNLYRFDDAEAVMREGWELARDVHGSDHSVAILNTHNYATLLQARGRSAQAEPLATAALEAALRLYGPRHPETARSLVLVADLRLERGDVEGAEPLAREALAIREAMLPGGHRLRRYSVLLLAKALARSAAPGALDEAEGLVEELRVRCAELGSALEWTCAMTEMVRGFTLTARGRYEEAEDVLCRTYEGLVMIRGVRSIEVRECLAGLSRLYSTCGQPDRAAQIEATLVALPRR